MPTFTILGVDGKEYGPVTGEQVRQWIADRRATALTKVRSESDSEWKPLSALPEFALALAAADRQPFAGDAAANGPPPAANNLAVASLVLGLLGFCTLGATAVLGLVLGIVALRRSYPSQGRIGGESVAIGGICVSSVFLVFAVVGALLLPALAKAKAKAQTVNCISNMKQIGLALRMYASDNKGVLPPASNWCDSIQVYLGAPQVLVCPATARKAPRSGYAFNAALSGVNEEKGINPQTVMVFECAGGWNVSGGPAVMAQHHPGTFVVGLADGSVMQVPASQISRLRWVP